MKNHKIMKRNLLIIITALVLLNSTACRLKNKRANSEIMESASALDSDNSEKTEINDDNTSFVDMTVPDENSKYGVIYYTPSDKEHIVSSDDRITRYVDNEILIVADEKASREDIADFANKYDAEIVGEIEVTGDYQLKFHKAFTIDELDRLASELKSDSLIENAHPNYVLEMTVDSIQASPPSGLNYGDEWRKEITEYDGKGLSWGWEAIHTNEAWEYLSANGDKINKNLKIGLIDSGFYTASKMDLEFAETFYDNSNNNKNQTNEDRKHGTHVAGTMAAISDNEKGICGVYPYGKGNLYGVCSPDTYIENNYFISCKIAMAELILRNVKVINISMGYSNINIIKLESSENEEERKEYVDTFTDYSEIMGDYLQRFIDKGYDFVIVNASGNTSNRDFEVDGKNIHTGWITTQYISPFSGIDKSKHPDVYNRIIVVGSVDSELKLSYFCNIGDRVDIFAPGENIYSTIPQVKYDYDTGTSMASPHVAGVAAMVWSANSSLTGADVKRIVCESGKAAANSGYTFGIPIQLTPDSSNSRAYFVNAAKAVEMSVNSFSLWADETKPEQKTETENGAILCWVVSELNSDIKLSGATIEAIDENDSTKVYTTASDEGGHFELILPEGTYTVTVKYEQYKDYVKTGVKVTNEGVNYLDDWIKMKPVIDFSGLSGRYFITFKGGDYEITIKNDGSFTAAYHVDNPFTSEIIRSEFKGVFSFPAKTDDYTYSFTIKSGKSTYKNKKMNEDGVTYDCKESEIKVGSEFRIYTKDAPDSILPITFVDIRNSVQNGTLGYVINSDYSYLLYDVSNDRSYCSEK